MSRPVAPDLADRIAGLSPEKREILEEKLRARDAQAFQADEIPRRLRRETAPLSFAQQRLYFLDRLEPGSAAYNVPRAIRIRGPLVVPALEKAFEELIRRHEALRSRFVEVSGEVVAEIEPADSTFLIDVERVGAARPDDREREGLRIAHEEAERPFDLEIGPILRVRLLELEPQHHILLFTLHHIASDAWSAGVLFGELTALYEAFSLGRPSPLAELPLQYGDFAEWQRRWLEGDALQEQLQYWRERLAGAPAALEISTDSPRPPLQSFHGEVVVRQLSPQLSDAIRELSRRERVTLFMTLLGAFQTLLSRYTGQTDILVGTPILHRSRPELEGMIGLFLNTVVLRTDLSGDPTFRALLAKVREVAVGAYAHQDLPFEKIVEDFHPSRDLGRHPIFQTMVALRNTPKGQVRMAGLELESLEIERKTSKFDFSLFFNDHPEGLVCAVEYATDLFDRETIERLLDHLRVLLESVTRDPDQRVRTVPILTERERKQLLVDWNSTASEYPAESCLHEVFEAQVERTPDGVALIESGRPVRYRDLNSEANRLARLLRRRGVDRGSVVAVSMERSARASMALLGVLKAGAAYVPLDPSYPEERLVFMLEDSGARILLTENSSTPGLEGISADRISLDQIGAELAEERESNLGRTAGPQDLAYVIYTSGSTGVPKGVE
ncbi:MAG: condensation domain-containing protein, partial [Acidobacteriota bacterium]|nr:condensation domain-containing protein [Acidobacteriota bacterium]